MSLNWYSTLQQLYSVNYRSLVEKLKLEMLARSVAIGDQLGQLNWWNLVAAHVFMKMIRWKLEQQTNFVWHVTIATIFVKVLCNKYVAAVGRNVLDLKWCSTTARGSSFIRYTQSEMVKLAVMWFEVEQVVQIILLEHVLSANWKGEPTTFMINLIWLLFQAVQIGKRNSFQCKISSGNWQWCCSRLIHSLASFLSSLVQRWSNFFAKIVQQPKPSCSDVEVPSGAAKRDAHFHFLLIASVLVQAVDKSCHFILVNLVQREFS